jgi:hypothetical protein
VWQKKPLGPPDLPDKSKPGPNRDHSKAPENATEKKKDSCSPRGIRHSPLPTAIAHRHLHRETVLVIVRERLHRNPDLPQMIQALRLSGLQRRARNRREQQSRENRDNRHHHQ